jgi:murein DD-endopeptidase MepM/ murein hydrolase activator NlpD
MAAAIAVLLLSGLVTPLPARAQSAGDVSAAQKKANAAAARFAAAQSALARAEAEVKTLKAKRAAALERVSALESQVRTVAVEQYIQGGVAAGMTADNLVDATRGQALLRFAVTGSLDALDQYRAAREDLEVSTAALESRLKQQTGAVASLRKQKAAADNEVKRLAAAQRALEAKRAAAAAAAARKAGRPAASRGATTSGGRTSFAATGSWMCPVQGPRAFSNDWGQPRSGGRRHQGTDILSPRGTPIVANVGGSVSPHNSGLGGISYYLRGDDGNTYFGTHLDSLSGVSGRVAQGTVIGRVGNTGNARGGPPHLHFEIHPGGGGAVNPYPTLAKYC